MLGTRNLICLLAVLALAGGAQAQTALLQEDALLDNFFRVRLTMKLSGKTMFQQEGKTIEQPLEAEAEHDYLEKILEEKTLDGGGSVSEKSARIYKSARAAITFNKKKGPSRTFRPDRTFLVTQRHEQGILTYSPQGSLTRDEVELTEHFNTLALTGLLPGKEVKVGASWPVSKDVAQSLCALEALESHDLACKLEEVKNQTARVSVTGMARGIDLGSAVTIVVQATCDFDLREKRLTALTWKQSDQREQGPANPAMAADVVITVERSAIQEPQELNRVFLGATIPAGKTPPQEMTLIAADEPGKRFQFQHTRDWIQTAQTEGHTVLRLMNQGTLLAQATLTPWPKLKPGATMSFKDFVAEIKSTPTWEEDEKIAEDDNVKMKLPDHQAYRYAAKGTLGASEVIAYFWLLMGPQGDHLIVTFTMKPSQAKDLGVRDLDFVRNIAFTTPQVENVPAAELEAPTPEPKKED